jgi:hypothetical protein
MSARCMFFINSKFRVTNSKFRVTNSKFRHTLHTFIGCRWKQRLNSRYFLSCVAVAHWQSTFNIYLREQFNRVKLSTHTEHILRFFVEGVGVVKSHFPHFRVNRMFLFLKHTHNHHVEKQVQNPPYCKLCNIMC